MRLLRRTDTGWLTGDIDMARGDAPAPLDRAAAATMLRRHLGEGISVRAMRAVLADLVPGLVLAGLSDGDVVAQLAEAVARGRVRVVLEPPRWLTSFGDAGEDTPLSAPPPPEARERFWISFRLVDWDGSPVAGERFRATLSDGRVESGRLDGSGEIAWDDIASEGRCSITFPDIDASGDTEPGRGESGSIDYTPGKPPSAPTGARHVLRLGARWELTALEDAPEGFIRPLPVLPPLREVAEDDDGRWELVSLDSADEVSA